jgi:DNA-binding CsgD family transcriptional regulator/tetratricopeptide (TPR) repeat protein
VGLAALGLLSEVAAEQPLVCIIDDEQWLDSASAQVLAFVARRSLAESLAIVFAARTPSDHLDGLPELVISGLAENEARLLLERAWTAPLDVQVREQIVAETRGNPLAILELPRGLAAVELAGGFGVPGIGLFAGSVEANFRERIEALPNSTRLLLVLASAETSGDSDVLWRAAGMLGIPTDAAKPAAEADLAELGAVVRFRHPLVRSAAYGAASEQDRQQSHRALAKATDAEADADRRAWHLAQACPGPDDEIAAELAKSAGRAQSRGGIAAAAAFLAKATAMTLDRPLRAERALAAATANVDAGAVDAAMRLLAVAERGPLTELQQSRLDLINAQLAFVTNRGREAPPLLVKAAQRLEPIDPELSRTTYLDAFAATQFAGRFAGRVDAWDVARHAGAAQSPQSRRGHDLLLDGLVANYNVGYSAGVPLLQKALDMFRSESDPAVLRWLWLACVVASHTWDDRHWHDLSELLLERTRGIGVLSELPLALTSRAFTLLFAGDLNTATALIEELAAVSEVTADNSAPYGALGIAAFRGNVDVVAALSESTLADAHRRGEGNAITCVGWANAVLNNGRGRYPEAMAAAEVASAYPGDLGGALWNPIELVEAAVRSGNSDTAIAAYARVREMARACGTDWACGMEARAHALLSDGDTAEGLYQESIARLGRTRTRTQLARAHLLYGEWLRRERRRADARHQLRRAHLMFEAMGMEAFAARSRRELEATGESARRRSDVTPSTRLTPQEGQVASLARDGLSNPEIGARLFISPRTVQYHLSSVFAKLGVASRSQLDGALPARTTGGTD